MSRCSTTGALHFFQQKQKVVRSFSSFEAKFEAKEHNLLSMHCKARTHSQRTAVPPAESGFQAPSFHVHYRGHVNPSGVQFYRWVSEALCCERPS